MIDKWNERALGEIAELRGRIGWKGLTAKEYTKSGPRFLSVHSLNYGPYVDFRDAFHISQERYDESPEIMLQEDDILICKDGAGIGKLGIAPKIVEPTTINSSLLLIRPGKEVVPKYLYYCLLSPYFQRIVQSRLEGATTPHLYQRDIATFPVFLAPKSEQRRIVAILDEAFEGLSRARANTEANLQSTRELFDEAVTECFFRASDTGTKSTLGTLATFRNGLNFTKASRGKSVKIVGVGDFKDHFVIPLDGLSHITVDGDLSDEDRLRPGDLLSVRSNGNRELIGRTMMMPNVEDEVSFSGFTIRIRLNSEQLLPQYLCEFMRTKAARRKLIDGGGGANISNLNQKLLSDLEITFPDVERQRLLLIELAQLRRQSAELLSIYSAKLQDLEDLRQSLLQKAFAGELTVKEFA